jgi:hypothetical protein
MGALATLNDVKGSMITLVLPSGIIALKHFPHTGEEEGGHVLNS